MVYSKEDIEIIKRELFINDKDLSKREKEIYSYFKELTKRGIKIKVNEKGEVINIIPREKLKISRRNHINEYKKIEEFVKELKEI